MEKELRIWRTTGDTIVAGIGAYVLATGLAIVLLLQLQPSVVTELFGAEGGRVIAFGAMLSVFGIAVLSAEVGISRVWKGFSWALFSLTALIAVVFGWFQGGGLDVPLFPRVPMAVLESPDVLFGLAALTCVLSLISDRRARIVGFAAAFLLSAYCASSLLTNALSTLEVAAAPFLVALVAFVALGAPVRWGIQGLSAPLRFLASVPFVFVSSSVAVCAVRQTGGGAVQEWLAIVGTFVAVIASVWVGVGVLKGEQRTSSRAIDRNQKALDLTEHALDGTGTGTWTASIGESGLVFSEEGVRIVGEARFPLTGELGEAIEKAFGEGGGFELVVRKAMADGSERLFEFRGRIGSQEGGPVREVCGSVRDVTDEVEANRTLESELTRLRLVASSVIDLVFLYDVRAQEYVFMSEPASGILKEVASAPGPHKLLDRVHEEDRRQFIENSMLCEASRDSKVFSLDCRLVDSAGMSQWCQCRCRAVAWDEDGRPTMIRGTVQDISERVASENALRESETRLRAVIAATPGIVFRKHVGKDGSVTFPFLSEACRDLIGIPASVAMSDPGQAVARIYLADRESYAQALDRSVQTLLPMSWIGRVYGEGDDPKWIHIRSTPTRQSDGATVFDGVALDVTETQKALTALQRTNARLDFLLEESPTVVYSCSGERPYLVNYVGSNLRNLFGHSPEELQNRPLFDLGWVWPDDALSLQEHAGRFLDHSESSAEYRIVGASGRLYWVRDEVQMVSLTDESFEVIGLWTDVTPLKNALEDLRAANEETIATDLIRKTETGEHQNAREEETGVVEAVASLTTVEPIEIVVVSTDPGRIQAVTRALRERSRATVRVAPTAGQAMEMCVRDRPGALFILDSVGEDEASRVVRAVREEPDLCTIRICIDRSLTSLGSIEGVRVVDVEAGSLEDIGEALLGGSPS